MIQTLALLHFYPILLGGMHFGNTDFTKRLSYGGWGGGGGASGFADDPNPGGRGENGGGLVYLLLDELTLDGTIESSGKTYTFP